MANPHPRGGERTRRSWRAAVLLAFLAAAFVGGLVVAGQQRTIDYWQPRTRLLALVERFVTLRERSRVLWQPARSSATGVVRHDPGRAWDGVTLYSSGHTQGAFLIDNAGNLLHRWELRYSDVFEPGGEIDFAHRDDFTWFRKAHLLPNGDLLAIYEAYPAIPYGFGLVRMDADSRLIWKYLRPAHHALDVGPDGRIYVLIQPIATEPIPGLDLSTPLLHEHLAILSPDGEEQQVISLLEAFRDSPYAHFLQDGNRQGNHLHPNSVDVLIEDMAAVLPFAEAGQVMIAFQMIDTLAVLDPERGTIVWATKGPWKALHDPDVLENGNILLFDNRGGSSRGGFSRVLEVDPLTMAIEWSFEGSESEPLHSHSGSGQQVLPNGNILITEMFGGRILEVTRDEEVVWEYLNPARAGPHDELVAFVAWAQRYDRAALSPEFARRLDTREAELAEAEPRP